MSVVFTKEQILEAIEKAKTVNCWAISDNVELTYEHETNEVVVWNGEGDYDAWYAETEIDMILAEAQGLEDFYTNN
jgi:hypothetical protein